MCRNIRIYVYRVFFFLLDSSIRNYIECKTYEQRIFVKELTHDLQIPRDVFNANGMKIVTADFVDSKIGTDVSMS